MTCTFTCSDEVYMVEYADKIATNAQYHPVWKKAETAQSGKQVKVTYSFTP